MSYYLEFRQKLKVFFFYLPQMLKISFAADKDVDDVILVVLIPLLDPLPPLVSVGKGRLVGDVISDNDGVGTGVVKLSFDFFLQFIGKWFHSNIIPRGAYLS